MPGGLDPFPRRFGRIKGRNIEILTNSILSQRGTAYSTDTNSKVWLQSMAIGRILAAAWETNQRLSNQFDPDRVTTFLQRWEQIYGISPPFGATPSQRRAAVSAKWKLVGKPATIQGLKDLLKTLLPNTYVGVLFLTSAQGYDVGPANVTPGSGGQPGGGVMIFSPNSGPVSSLGFWSSTIHWIAIQVQQPAGMLNADFYREIGQVHNGTLDSFLPAWVHYSVFRDSTVNTTAPGFYFDDSSGNLDLERVTDVCWGVLSVGGSSFTQRVFPIYQSQQPSLIGTTYANYYGFTVSTPETLTITISRAVGSGIGVFVISGTSPNGTVVASLTGSGPLTLHTGTLAAGSYVLEVNSDSADALGVSPCTLTMTIATP